MSDTEIIEESETAITTKSTEQYHTWKSNAPALYDYLNTFNNVWPSLTVQFFPDNDQNKHRRTTYRLLTSTYTSSSLPQHLQINTFTTKSLQEETDLSKYDTDLHEFQSTDPISGKLTTIQKILHQGEINRARILPQNPDIISTITSAGSVYIFDKTKHSSHEAEFKCEIECKGHTDEGFGLSWNNNSEGKLLSGAMDGHIKLWDITRCAKNQKLPAQIDWDNVNGVNDVEWCPFHDSVFVSGSEDDYVKVWDTRQNVTQTPKTSAKLHSSGVNAVSWNKSHQYLVASGDGEGKVNVWDIRKFETPITTIHAHDGGVSSVEFNPTIPNVIATSGFDDNAVKLWNLSKKEPLVFHHAGHLLGVNDISWNAHEPWMVASVSNDNTVHLWTPSPQALGI